MDIYMIVNKILNVMAKLERKDMFNRRFDHSKPMPRFLSLKRLDTSTLKHLNGECMEHLLAFTLKY